MLYHLLAGGGLVGGGSVVSTGAVALVSTGKLRLSVAVESLRVEIRGEGQLYSLVIFTQGFGKGP